jgi:hypothetical protein
MQPSGIIRIVFLTIALLWPVFSSGESSSKAKVCGYLPIAELEAHFGSKTTAFRGDDGRPGQDATCSVDIPDRMHGATIISKKPNPPGHSVKEHLAEAQPIAVEIKDFGSVGCYITRGLPATICFLDAGHYLSLSLISDDPQNVISHR